MRRVSRRRFMAMSAGAASLTFVPQRSCAVQPPPETSFFLIGDTHLLADKARPDALDPVSVATNAQLVDVLNRLPGAAIPEAAGGGEVLPPQGVIHAGDLIDSGDKNGGPHPQMKETEWRGYVAEYGLSGKDGRLKYPIYEVHGNHDSPPGDGLVISKIVERNKSRPGVTNVSANGLHYSWDWRQIHFIALGIVVGSSPETMRKRRYNPLDSLAFLIADLKDKVGASGRPVVITHHVDVARYSTDPNPTGPATNAEWDPVDVRGYHEALKNYNVAAILYGHTHARNIYQWDGTPKRATQGWSVFNVDNSAHFGSPLQAAFYFQTRGDELLIREFFTKDRWQTFDWTPQAWTAKLTRPQEA